MTYTKNFYEKVLTTSGFCAKVIVTTRAHDFIFRNYRNSEPLTVGATGKVVALFFIILKHGFLGQNNIDFQRKKSITGGILK